MMTTSLILASAIGNGIVHLLCLILFVFFACGIAGLLTIPVSTIVCEYIHSKFKELSIKHRWRDEALSYIRHRAKDFNGYLAHPSSDEDLRFLCEVLSHRQDDTFSVQASVRQYIFRDLLHESPLRLKYYVDLLVAYGWDINHPFPFESNDEDIKKRISWAPGTNPVKKALWQSIGTNRNRFIGNLAELLTVSKRYDVLYLILCEYPAFSISCRSCLESREEDLLDTILLKAYEQHDQRQGSITANALRTHTDTFHAGADASNAGKFLDNLRGNPSKAEVFFRWMNFDKHAKTSIHDGLAAHERKPDTNQIGCGALCSLGFLLTLFTILFFFFLFVAFPTTRFWNELVTPDAEATTSQVAHERYWVTSSSGKTHNSSCRYYANSKGHYSSKGTGNNCRICGGANE